MTTSSSLERRSGRRALLRNGFAAFLASTLAACGSGGADPSPGRSPATTGVGTTGLGIVGLVVADVGRSLTFYRRLGLDVPADFRGDSYRLAAPNGTLLFWESPAVVRGFDPGWRPATGDRRIVVEFGFERADVLDATCARLVDGGAVARLEPFWLGPGLRYAVVTDPDGNQISLRSPAVS